VLFLEGVSAVVAAVIVFCGSVFLLLSMVMGGRLAYFVTASITLAVLLILAVVWSLPAVNPLGPVGTLPRWNPVAIGADAASLDFGAATSYPDAPWQKVDSEDVAQATQASELEAESTDSLQAAIDDGKVDTFESVSDATVNTDLTRLLQQGAKEFGAVTLEPVKPGAGEPTVAILAYDPGNPLGPARRIAAGTFVLLVLHLFGLSRSERRAHALGRAAP
jgi:hypothetical protein